MFRLVHLLVLIFTVRGSVIDLNGDWTVCSSNGTCLKGTVPGDIYTDLHSAGLIPHPLKGDNSLALDWVSREKWTYSRKFSLAKEQLTNTVPALLFEGIDTVATVYLNGERLLNADNQFRRYVLEVADILAEENCLEVRFESPVLYSQHKSEKYKDRTGHELPPICPPDIYHGECHPNFIRKAQYSFSWDWGPSITTVGVWRPVSLLLPSKPTPLSVSLITEKQKDKWRVLGSLEYWNIPGEVECSVRVGDVGNSTLVLSGKGTERRQRAEFVVEVPVDKIEVWWPATEGNPKLYDLTVFCGQDNSEQNVLKEEIGFRTVELIQNLVDTNKPKKGRHFYFKINGKPIFLKGSNWIPSSMFPGENTDKRVEFLLDSAVEANMNVLRVWGGGVYESEYFYRLANRKGLLLWQDMMFACALYPTDKRFLTTVSAEVEEQVYRLRKHPSILVFAGNNENEVAIRTHWWGPENYSEKQQVDDYVVLYANTIAPIVKVLDPSRPFLLSSPGNGLETEEEGGVAKNPGDVRYGDIHFYNEFVNLWQDYNYLTPRCASEYGIQSFPFRDTMLNWINESDWSYFSERLVHRQHHPGGLATNLLVVYEHFPISLGCSLNRIHECKDLKNPRFMDRFAYYSQAHQAIMYKTQTEHYRRFRGKLTEDGRGNTMCALYWQLNDVWAAPTWSSVDFDLNWKMVHYEAKRFFAPIIVVLYSTERDDLGVTVVNDGKKIEGDTKVRILQFGWGSGFHPVYKKEKLVVLPEAGVVDITFGKLDLLDYDSEYVFAAELINNQDSLLSPTMVLLPDKLFQSQLYLCGNVSIEDFKRIDDTTYSLTVVATELSPLTWLSLEAENHPPFWFSDNGFTMITPRKTVILNLREPFAVNEQQISVCNIKTCGL